MQKRYRQLALVLLLLTLLSVPRCSSDDDGGTQPEPPKQVLVTGTIELPAETAIDPTDLTVRCGDSVSDVDSTGGFSESIWEHTPGALIAVKGDGAPVLMAIVADPTTSSQPRLDARSTAQALVFLSPFVCVSDKDDVASVLDQIEEQQSFTDLVEYITQGIQSDPDALTAEDTELDNLLTQVVTEYVAAGLPRRSPESSPTVDVAIGAKPKSSASPPTIQPDYEVSGLRLVWNGGSEYELRNSYGRWAYCCAPSESLYIFPNGDFLDWIRKGEPWPPSKKKLTLSVSETETTFVNVFGYGCLTAADNNWDALSPQEQLCAHYGGFITVTFELCSHVLSVVTNSARLLGHDDISKRINETILKTIFSDGRILQRVGAYMQANDPWGCSWFLTKQVLQKLATSESYREAFQLVTGINLTSGMLASLGAWLAVPAKVTLTFNSVSSVFKTALALNWARYKTTFRIWKEYEDFGVIRGMVADKTSGLGIGGATVIVGGDDNNPLNPPHEKTTDEDGHYRFENIGAGARTITSQKSGYRSNSVAVTVVKDQTVEANVELERTGAGVSGYVRNDIFIHHGLQNTSFKGDVNLHCREIGGDHSSFDTWVRDGVVAVALSEGRWKLTAEHDDYDADSVEVQVPSDGSVQLPRDLVLKPHPTMTGRIWIDSDNNGGYEVDFAAAFQQVGLSAEEASQDPCPLGGSPGVIMRALAIRGSTTADVDLVEFAMRMSAITEAGTFRIGGVDTYACEGSSAAAGGAMITSRVKCNYPDVGSFNMSFTFLDDPESRGCNCGINEPGTLFLTEFSNELGEVVAGGFNIDLAGWRTCQCSGSDTDSDGIIDEWDVSCAKARLQLDFRLPVGSDYLVTNRPYGRKLDVPVVTK